MKLMRWLLPLSLVLIILSLSIGASSQFSWVKLLAGDNGAVRLFFESRLPRTLAIILAAGSMSLSGLLMQTVTQNNYAAPSTVGTVEAAQLGMLVSLFFFPQATLAQKMLFAFVSSMVFTIFFIRVIRKLSFQEKWQLPLVGLIYGGVIGAFAEIIAYRYNLVQSMTAWTQGSFAMIQTHQYEWLFLNLIIVVVVWRFAQSFSIMSLGEEASINLGLPFQTMEGLALFLVALTTSVTMITVGSLPFLGVIVPNVIRRFLGDHLQKTKLVVAVLGICLVLLCDIFARLIIRPYELSVSVVLGVVGSAIFIIMIWRGETYAD